MPEKNELIVYDRILTKTGKDKYATNATETINIGLIENKGAFEINVNPAAMLSSNLEDYQPGETIRGFSFSTNIEGENYLYAFAVRTDAK